MNSYKDRHDNHNLANRVYLLNLKEIKGNQIWQQFQQKRKKQIALEKTIMLIKQMEMFCFRFLNL